MANKRIRLTLEALNPKPLNPSPKPVRRALGPGGAGVSTANKLCFPSGGRPFPLPYKKESLQNKVNLGALIIRTGFGGILYYTYNKEPPKPYSNY